MTQPFNPFAQYGQPPAQAPTPPQAQGFATPGPAGYAPPGPAAYTPPQGPAAPAPVQYGAPPQGFAPPTYGAPPVAANPYAGADNAPSIVRTPNIPDGQHEFECVKFERATTGSGEFVFITFKVIQSNNPSWIGQECAFKQNMNPAAKGGKNIAFSALKAVFFPLLGFELTDPQVNSICEQGHFSNWLLEAETRGTVAGQPLAGRRVYCIATPTAPKSVDVQKGRTQGFPQLNFRPVGNR